MNNKLGAWLLCLAAASALVAGCTTNREVPDQTIREVYEGAYREGARDSVRLLKEGLRTRGEYGHTDDYKPVRRPDVVMPIWVLPRPGERTDGRRRVSGHWVHSVVKRSDWTTD